MSMNKNCRQKITTIRLHFFPEYGLFVLQYFTITLLFHEGISKRVIVRAKANFTDKGVAGNDEIYSRQNREEILKKDKDNQHKL